jgi:hypothetical protein
MTLHQEGLQAAPCARVLSDEGQPRAPCIECRDVRDFVLHRQEKLPNSELVPTGEAPVAQLGVGQTERWRKGATRTTGDTYKLSCRWGGHQGRSTKGVGTMTTNGHASYRFSPGQHGLPTSCYIACLVAFASILGSCTTSDSFTPTPDAGVADDAKCLFSPLPGDGTTKEWCDVPSTLDIGADGNVLPGTLRDRLELFNHSAADDSAKCLFCVFFLFANKTIVLQKPLALENALHPRKEDGGVETETGTYVSGYGSMECDSKSLNVTIDAIDVTANATQCAFMLKGGMASKHQIHGLNIIVRKGSQAICDDMGVDLLSQVDPNCTDGKLGRECSFNDVAVLVPSPQ